MDKMVEATFDFGALAAQLKPKCEALIAQYEQPRSALLPMMHLFQDAARLRFAGRDAICSRDAQHHDG